jgi:hypothetical protein
LHYQITVKIKPLYLTHYTYYMTSSTIRGRTKILGFPTCFELLIVFTFLQNGPVLVALPQGGKSSKMHTTKPNRQPQFLETSTLESVRSLRTEPTHSQAKKTAETA